MTVKSRRSIRHFSSSKVSRDIVRHLIDLAKWAPSAHNAQPWRVIVVDDERTKERLASDMRKVWLSDLLDDGYGQAKAEAIVKRRSWDSYAKNAVVLIVCLTMKDMKLYADANRRNAEHTMAVQSVAAFVQTLLLVAHDKGLGAGWFSAPLFCQGTVRRTLKLPKTLEPQALVLIGYRDQKRNSSRRKSVGEILCFHSLIPVS
jgi:coenzyme F420-0:L-glutamate ligase/coenzyme F420-1:gamma-L-glutamate ligase